MRTIPTILLALTLLASACAPVGSRELHEVALVEPGGATKLRYVYGDADRMVLNARERAIGGLVGDAAEGVAYAVPASRTIDGAPYLRTSLDRSFEAPIRVDRVPLSSDLQVSTSVAVERALYYDGTRWLTLGRDLEAGRTRTVAATPASGRLRGAGSLTPAEADALATELEEDAPVVVAVLPSEEAAAITGAPSLAPRPEDGLEEYRHTVLWVQRGLGVDASAWAPPPEDLVAEVVARGDQGEDPGEDRFVLIRDDEALRRFWNAAHANAFTPPASPGARFGRETLLGVRLSARPTGGYGVELVDVFREEGDLVAEVRLTEPQEGAVVTQAVTTPWLLARILGVDASVLWVRDADTGELIAVARADGGDAR